MSYKVTVQKHDAESVEQLCLLSWSDSVFHLLDYILPVCFSVGLSYIERHNVLSNLTVRRSYTFEFEGETYTVTVKEA